MREIAAKMASRKVDWLPWIYYYYLFKVESYFFSTFHPLGAYRIHGLAQIQLYPAGSLSQSLC